MNQILFEGVRCFHEFHSQPLKRITMLVGENSSGKTTFLALSRIAWDIAQGNSDADIFNEEPFPLGSFDQIASYRGGKAGRAKSFTIGLQIQLELKQALESRDLFADQVKITARYSSQGIEEWQFECGKFRISVKQRTRQDRPELTVTTPLGVQKSTDDILAFFRPIRGIGIITILPYLLSGEFRNPNGPPDTQPSVLTKTELGDLQTVYRQVSLSIGQRPYAFAPIRTRPQRTYDPLKEVPKPEGSHVPMVLARVFLEESGGNKELKEALSSFGKASGLFNSLEVKRKGQKESDPFQISVKTLGQAFNLVDVGYGVSQALPIIVDALQNPKGSTFLLQQPEVHLHPKAQAELGSFLAALAKSQDKQFIIETHSDYLIDRLRMDIRDKKFLGPEDVGILYFEKTTSGVEIHNLEIDEYGNLVNAPSTYRQFFLAEESRMFGI